MVRRIYHKREGLQEDSGSSQLQGNLHKMVYSQFSCAFSSLAQLFDGSPRLPAGLRDRGAYSGITDAGDHEITVEHTFYEDGKKGRTEIISFEVARDEHGKAYALMGLPLLIAGRSSPTTNSSRNHLEILGRYF